MKNIYLRILYFSEGMYGHVRLLISPDTPETTITIGGKKYIPATLVERAHDTDPEFDNGGAQYCISETVFKRLHDDNKMENKWQYIHVSSHINLRILKWKRRTG